jgi:hypothetical protein
LDFLREGDTLHHALEAMNEDLLRERLREIVVGAAMEVIDRALDGTVSRHDDDRDERIIGLHGREELIAGKDGHADVGDEDVDLLRLDPVERFLAVGGELEADVGAIAAEDLEEVEVRLVVVGNEHRDHQKIPLSAFGTRGCGKSSTLSTPRSGRRDTVPGPHCGEITSTTRGHSTPMMVTPEPLFLVCCG